MLCSLLIAALRYFRCAAVGSETPKKLVGASCLQTWLDLIDSVFSLIAQVALCVALTFAGFCSIVVLCDWRLKVNC